MKRKFLKILTVAMSMALIVTFMPSMSAMAEDTVAAKPSIEDAANAEESLANEANMETPVDGENQTEDATKQPENTKEQAQGQEIKKIEKAKAAPEEKGDKVQARKKEASARSFDASTTLSDGNYMPDKFSYSGGTGKVSIKCTKVTVTKGTAYGTLVFGSEYYTRMKVNGVEYSSNIDKTGKTATFVIPLDLNAAVEVIATTTAMSKAHEIKYTLNVSLSEPVRDSLTEYVDNSTLIGDATYRADSFTVKGGTGKVKISCSCITISGGKSYATLVFASKYYSQLRASGFLYRGIINEKANTSTFVIPIRLNSDNSIIGRTTAMSAAHDINYTINAALTATSAKITPGADPGSGGGGSGTDEVKKKKLKDGTYRIRTEVTGKMFYIYPKDASTHYSILTVKDGKYKAVITLDGQGYDYVYMGTAAKAAGAAKADWSRYRAKNGFYSYRISVNRLDKKLSISAHSRKYKKWYGDRTIKFYSGTARKVKSGTTTTGNKKSKYKKRSGKSTVVSGSATTALVNNATTLKDGTCRPESFSWSGGSGRLAYIKCTRIRVTGGRAYATIVFGSSSYDRLKAAGSIYSRSGSGCSTFVIPVRLNENNVIIGRTTAMSQAHWVRYSIYIAISEGEKGSSSEVTSLSTEKLPKKAPTITGLKYRGTTKIKYASLFRIYRYDHGVTMVVMDMTKRTGLFHKEDSQKKSAADEPAYDEEGNMIERSQHDITEELYQNNIVNYLVVPKGYDVPAGLDKKCIIVEKPAARAYIASKSAMAMIDAIDMTDRAGAAGTKGEGIRYAGSYKAPRYDILIREKTKLCVLPSKVLPAKVAGKASGFLASDKYEKKAAEVKAKKKLLKTLESRFTAIDVPVIVDRSQDEKTRLGKAEWIKVYGVLYGCEKKAGKVFKKEVKDEKKH